METPPSVTAKQESFFSDLIPGQVSTNLLNMLPDVITWIKDLNGVYIHVNIAFGQTIQKDISEIIGKTDSDFFGPELSNTYVQDDQKLLETGEPILEKPELVTYRPGVVRWFLTSKIPLFDKDGKICGMAGLSRPSSIHTNSNNYSPMKSISKALDFLYENQSKAISVEKLASICGLSVSSLERHFRKHFNTSPGRYITQVKISTACELLADPSLSVSDISDRLGFTDPVVFSRVFKREMKVTPSGYRKSL